ncbi:MAG: GCN5-related N-acetyltransferase [Paenibacillus sp.]|uniref:GNAT family N-acetyltransferase n=1 Tax=Paenibacillus sp. GCM10012303 TaxID=3317340 RepID=UPI0029EB1663|nr:GCN5-related N-acetyltransferase [Paenibacillus sp.]
MQMDVTIVPLHSVRSRINELAELLIRVVEDGASVGFMPPLSAEEATRYWEGVPGPDVVLYAALAGGRVAGSVQLHVCTKPNGSHRAEIAKLMTHPDYRRHGIGRRLMLQAEAKAAELGRTLLVLDTREGDPSNRLYSSIGYTRAGRIPGYARSADGELHATVYYYKNLGE